MASVPSQHIPVGGRIYSRIFLHLYDFFVFHVLTRFFWRCPTKSVLVPFFFANAGERHMDVGVGTGYFPAALHRSRSSWPQHLTLVDVNPSCLEWAAEQVGLPERTTCVRGNALDTLRLPAGEPTEFDSISLMLLLHCLPCSPAEKTRVFANVKQHLSPNGTLFGATILGRGVRLTRTARLLLSMLRRVGAVSNADDRKEDFLDGLSREFEEVEGNVVGCILLFSARKPRKQAVD